MNKRDSIYERPRRDLRDFVFDEAVADVFQDMINRSVPGYATVVSMAGVLASRFVREGGICYDLGCSLGATTAALQQGIAAPGCRIVAVDNAEAMAERCRSYFARRNHPLPVEVRCRDLRDVAIEKASFVVLNYTLQFIAPGERGALIARIYDGLLPGGALLLSEKIRFDDPVHQAQFTDLHHAFKQANGYSELEISQKRTALERVLIPDTIEEHLRRLTAAGFNGGRVWFQCLNFASMLAIK